MSDVRRIALKGLSRLRLFPVEKNNESEYGVGEGFSVPFVQSMTRTADVSEQKIYADDELYLDVRNWNGLILEITLTQLDFQLMEKLGFGKYDDESDVFSWNPEGENKVFAMTFREQQTDNQYRMYRMFVFTVNEVRLGNAQTAGDDVSISSPMIIGAVTKRRVDDKLADIKESTVFTDMAWLDIIPTVDISSVSGASAGIAPANFSGLDEAKPKK